MRSIIKSVILAGALAGFAVVALKGAAILIPSGTWVPQTNLSSARANASAGLLQDGRVLITGGDSGSGPVATADFFAADGTISAAPLMVNARSKHVSVTLQDGRVLVAGGVTAGGSATSTAEIYDPTANSWTSIGTGMTEARSSASAALLPDGRVIIAGGQNGSSISSTIEIFDPVAESFSFVGTMSSPRTQHAMAVLQDGRVIITGGSNGTSPVASTDILDPVAGTISAGPSLAVARFGHSATTLLTGQVVVIGGNNGNADPAQMELASAELFDPAAGTFTALAANMATPREGHLAILLPNNNSVLIVGGVSGGTSIATAELFMPQESSQGAWTYGFGSTGSMSTARSNAAGSANEVNAPTSVMQRNGVLMVAGGNDASGNALNSTETYGYATIQTDQGDYPPGTTVTITGSGWKTGETVNLQLVESPLVDTHGPFSAVADANGNISNSSFVTDAHDASITFTLTAAGQTSGFQAQTTFTDAIKEYEATISPTSDTAGHASAGYTITIKNDPTSTNAISSAPISVPSGYSSIVLGTVTTSPAGLNWTASIAAGVITLTANGGQSQFLNADQSVTLALTATAPCTDATYTWVTSTAGNFAIQGSQPAVTISGSCTVPTTLVLNSVSPNSVPFGSTGSVTLTGTLKRNDTSAGVVGATVNFSVDDGAAIPATTVAGGVATVTTYNPSALSVGPHNVAASFTAATISGTSYLGSSSGTLPLTVNKATPVITWNNPADITYGTALGATQLNASAPVPGSFAYTPASGTVLSAGSSQTLHVDFTPTDTTDYNTAAKDVTINVLKATPTVTWANPADITYGTALSATQLDATFTAVVNGSTVTVGGTPTYTPPSGTLLNAGNAQSLSVSFTPTDTTDYNNAAGSAQINVLKATPTVTWANPADITYGAALSATQLNATFTWIVNGSTVTVGGTPTYTPPSGTLLNAGSAQSLSVSFAPGDTSNYNSASGSAKINVLKATPTVTWANPADITYGTALSATQLNATFTWIVNGSTVAVGGTPTYTPPSGTLLNAGSVQSLSVSFAPGDTSNYNSASGSAKINVLKATPTVTWANPADITYGTALSATQLDATFTAVVNGSTVTVGGTPTYTPPSGTLLNAGSAQSLSVSFTPTDTTDYNYATGSAKINVLKATPTVTWANPADITYGTALSATQLDATFTAVVNGYTVTVAGAPTYTPAAGTLLNAGNAQSLSVSFTPTDTTDYNNAAGSAQINVLKATPTVTWANPADITYGTALSATQLDATFTAVVNGYTVTVAGAPTYTPAAGTLLNAGNAQSLSVSFTPTDTTDYNYATGSAKINVLKATPTVTWANPADITYGKALSATQLNATFTWIVNGSTVTVGGTPTYTPPSGTLLNAGSAQSLSVSFAPGDTSNYNSASGSAKINVLKATPTVTWANPADITYGTALSATQLNATFTWVVNGSTVAVSGTPTYTPPSGTVLNVGQHQALAVSFTPSDTTDYNPPAVTTVYISVNYGFLGLQSPYMPPPTTFNVKRTMPLKWQYTNSGGAVVNSGSANPTVVIQGPYACGGGDSAGDITVNDAGASGYQYDPTTNTWQFNWQIKGNMPGCYDIYIESQQSGQTNGAFPISVVNQ